MEIKPFRGWRYSTSDGDVSLTVPVRAFTGAQESYAPSPTHS